MSVHVEFNSSLIYNNKGRNSHMIESFNDYISMAILLVLLTVSLYALLRMFFVHRAMRLQEEEIEYYQDW